MAAEATRESLIVGHLNSLLSNPALMDAFVIDASVIAIDGSGGIFGQAGLTTGFALTGGSVCLRVRGFHGVRFC